LAPEFLNIFIYGFFSKNKNKCFSGYFLRFWGEKCNKKVFQILFYNKNKLKK
jgi:hypothetical protein